MRTVFGKTVAASLAALVLGSSLAASTPASANPWHHHGYWGPAVALGVFGLAAGAIAASEYDCVRYRPVFDRYGNFIGREPVNIC